MLKYFIVPFFKDENKNLPTYNLIAQAMAKEQQLETWSKYQQLDILKTTYNSVKNVLKGFKLPEGARYAEPYLQGSYGNSTSIYGKGDIDIVVELTSAFRSNLTEEEKNKLETAQYSYNDFFSELYQFLIDHYKVENISVGNKTLKIKEGTNRKPVDVVAAITYHLYDNPDDLDSRKDIGIGIRSGDYNFPEDHRSNGVKKHKATSDMYKKYIRIFKNFKKRLDESIPSYFIECLLYNVPNNKFSIELCEGFEKIVSYLLNPDTDFDKFMSQNGIINLFGDQNTQWSQESAIEFISKCKYEYENL